MYRNGHGFLKVLSAEAVLLSREAMSVLKASLLPSFPVEKRQDLEHFIIIYSILFLMMSA